MSVDLTSAHVKWCRSSRQGWLTVNTGRGRPRWASFHQFECVVGSIHDMIKKEGSISLEVVGWLQAKERFAPMISVCACFSLMSKVMLAVVTYRDEVRALLWE